ASTPARNAAARRLSSRSRAAATRSRPSPRISAASAGCQLSAGCPAALKGGDPLAKLVNAARELSHSSIALPRCAGSGRGIRRRSGRDAGAGITQRTGGDGEPAAQWLAHLRIGHQGRKILRPRSEEHTSELQSRVDLVCRLLLEKQK